MNPAPMMVTSATPYAPSMPHRPIAPAPTNGPMKTPMRCEPPSVDRARARMYGGTTWVRYDWRARTKMLLAAPTSSMPSVNTTIPSGSRQSRRPRAERAEAPIIARRSPNRVQIMPEVMFVTSEPRPRAATTSDAVASLAPRSIALRATTGSSAPCEKP